MNPSAEILPTHTREQFGIALARAAELLRSGEVVAVPTETVYGLAANAFDIRAVEKIFRIKGRPSHNPIIVHIADLPQARACVQIWPPLAETLARAFWPGPLTLVLPKSDQIPDNVTAGGPTVGLRWPQHPFMQALIRLCQFPLAAPSANASGQLSPTRAEHVAKSLGTTLPLIIDGGPAQVGIESTVIDLATSPPRILRPGIIDTAALQTVAAEINAGDEAVSGPLRSPGLLLKHYAPKAKVVIWSWRDDSELEQKIAEFGPSVSGKTNKTHLLVHSCITAASHLGRKVVMPDDPLRYAKTLYDELHKSDELGAELIIVETPPESPEWNAIRDRLRRAAA